MAPGTSWTARWRSGTTQGLPTPIGITLVLAFLSAGATAQRLGRNQIVDLACVGDLDLDGSEDIVVHVKSEAYAVSGRTGHRH